MLYKHLNCFVALLVLVALTCACGSSVLTTTVDVTGGTIEGVEQDGIFAYKGIPFAAPPTGDLRWKAPAPVESWTGVKKADAFAPGCMQTANSMGNTSPVSEDCLYLNVWTPAKNTGEKLPVIYWIHGGGFSGGSTSTPMYDGTGFAQKGVVLVSVAYRLGPFGFMAHPELSSESGHGSGSYGMQDMIAGLEWVQKNIKRFGGDASNVTIFGHSAGGAAISILAASPLAKGLFHRAICMSGGNFGPLQTSNQPGMGMGVPSLEVAEANGEAFLKDLGVADIEAARALSAEEIQNALGGGAGGMGGGMRFRPGADGYVISNDLYTLFKEGKFNYTPILLGHTSNEMGSFGGRGSVTPEAFESQIKSQYGSYADALLSAYPHSTEAEATKASSGVRNDSGFAYNTWIWSRLQAQKGQGNAYQYYFNYNPRNPEAGSGHGSDVPYAFQTLGGGMGGPSPEDSALSDMINGYWINFARTGDPNGPGLPEWPAFTEDGQQVMVFDEAPSARPVPNRDMLEIFDAYNASIREQVE
jgi:para-nitrobenzyl esterase